MDEDTAETLVETRRELEGYAGDLHDIRDILQLATAADDPVPLTYVEVKHTIEDLDTLKTSILEAQSTLIKKETDEAAKKEDGKNKKNLSKECIRIKDQAYRLLYHVKASQLAKDAERSIRRIERSQLEFPTRNYHEAKKTANAELQLLKGSLCDAKVDELDPLFDILEDPEQRTMLLMSAEATPIDSKDFIKAAAKPSYKIAPLVIPKFNGKLEQRISFWEEFQHAIDKKEDMDDSTKLVYLKQAMLDQSLKSTISDLGIHDKAYKDAVNLLQERFNKPRIVHRQCCEALKNIPTDHNNRISLTSLADKGQHILTSLTRLKTLGASEILTSILELSVSKELKHEWLSHTAALTTTPPVEKIIAFIRQKADQAEGEEIQPISEQQNMPKPASSRNRGSHAAVTPPTSVAVVSTASPAPPTQSNQPTRGAPQSPRTDYPPCRYKCPLCTDHHYPYHCSVFKGYTARQRINHVATHNLCSSCLKPGHAAEVCRSTFNCRICKAAHNSLLHEEQTSVSTPAIGSTNTANPKSTESLKRHTSDDCRSTADWD